MREDARFVLCAGFLDAGAWRCRDSLRLPASEKRQGTKSRAVAPRRFSGLYGDSGLARILR